jgi:hypothetical protein
VGARGPTRGLLPPYFSLNQRSRQNGGRSTSDIAFNVRLGAADWDDTMSGWRCPALNVPGAKIEDVYVEGTRIDRAKYEVLQNLAVIRWAAGDRPTRATASITLTRALSLETETERWKRLAIRELRQAPSRLKSQYHSSTRPKHRLPSTGTPVAGSPRNLLKFKPVLHIACIHMLASGGSLAVATDTNF